MCHQRDIKKPSKILLTAPCKRRAIIQVNQSYEEIDGKRDTPPPTNSRHATKRQR